MPKAAQIGQKLIKAVIANMMAKTPKPMANLPEITPVKYKTAIMMATKIRNPLSIDPIFFFMMLKLFGDKILD